MPGNQSTDSGLYEYEENSYFSEGLDNNSVEDFDASPEDDFSEYLWMENEEEFDKEVGFLQPAVEIPENTVSFNFRCCKG